MLPCARAAAMVMGVDLRALALAAIRACGGAALTDSALSQLDLLPGSSLKLLATGKAAAAMAQGAVRGLARRSVSIEGGMLVTKVGHRSAVEPLTAFIGGHPEPSEASAAAGQALLRFVAEVGPEQRVLALLSGGTSALIATPRLGFSLQDLSRASRRLLASGADIVTINRERGRLSALAAGGLARACRGSIDVIVLSDVLGDDLASVGSGPYWLDDTSAARHHIAGNHDTLLTAAVAAAKSRGVGSVVRVTADRDDVTAVAARWIERVQRVGRPTLFIGGGEPTVSLPVACGVGGRNQQLALLMARALAQPGLPRASFLSIGSDGGDGNSKAAGAVIDDTSWSRMLACDANPQRDLAHADSHRALHAIDACIYSGPSETNLLDLHLLWVQP